MLTLTLTTVSISVGDAQPAASASSAAATTEVVAIRAKANNKFVTAEDAGDSSLIASRTSIGPWETFDLIWVNETDVQLRSHANGKFVCAEAAGAEPLISNRATPGPWETFQLISNSDGTNSLRARANNKIVAAESAGNAPLIANRTAVRLWEEFDLIEIDPESQPTTTTPTRTSTTTPSSTARPATTTSTPTPPSSTRSASSNGAIWKPVAGTTWQWQLSGTPDLSRNVGAYDVDWENTSAATVAAIHAKGAKAICYVDVGAVENGRPDSNEFPSLTKGNILQGWDEALLDIRQISILVPIQAARFQVCADKGFDGVELDVDEGFAEETGFNLTMSDQIAYNTALIKEVHRLGLAAGLKNGIYNSAPEKFIAAMEPITEYAIIEECASAGDCSILSPYINHNKAVFHAEYVEHWHVSQSNYQSALNAFCSEDKNELGFSSILTVTALSGWSVACP